MSRGYFFQIIWSGKKMPCRFKRYRQKLLSSQCVDLHSGIVNRQQASVNFSMTEPSFDKHPDMSKGLHRGDILCHAREDQPVEGEYTVPVQTSPQAQWPERGGLNKYFFTRAFFHFKFQPRLAR